MHLFVHGGQIITADGTVERADIAISDGNIAAIGDLARPSKADVVELDATGLTISAGWIDLQVNGGYGYDLATHPEHIAALAERLPEHGITSWLPTLVSTDQPTRQRFLDATAQAAAVAGSTDGRVGARCMGAHLEGPLLSEQYRGAHDAAVMADADLRAEIESGEIRLITLAPEHDAASDTMERAMRAGIAVAVGHTNATTAQVRDAADLGATYVTHLFNAMAPLHHRSPGPIGVALTDNRFTAGLIVDGIHLADEIVTICWRMLGAQRTSLVSDSTAALGSAPGTHRLGDMTIIIEADGVVRTPDGVLAGSSVGLDQCVRNLMQTCGASLADAIATVTTTPARLLAVADRGRLAPGLLGDLTLLDGDTQVAATVIGGSIAYLANPSIAKG